MVNSEDIIATYCFSCVKSSGDPRYSASEGATHCVPPTHEELRPWHDGFVGCGRLPDVYIYISIYVYIYIHII